MKMNLSIIVLSTMLSSLALGGKLDDLGDNDDKARHYTYNFEDKNTEEESESINHKIQKMHKEIKNIENERKKLERSIHQTRTTATVCWGILFFASFFFK